MSAFAVVKKTSSSWKNVFSKIKFFQLICAYKIFKTVHGNLYEKYSSRYNWVSVILKLRKMVLHNKIIKNIRSTKNQENLAHSFVDNYLTNHLLKFLQDRVKPWRVGAPRVCTGYHFF